MTHLTALLSKNYILWKRNCFCSCLEILLPIAFIAILLSIRAQIEKEDVPEKAFLYPDDKELVPRQLYPNMDGFQKQPNLDIKQLLQTLPQMKNCISNSNFEGSSYRNGYIALGPQNNQIAQTIASYFMDYYGYKIKWFQNNSEIDQYVREQYYGFDSEYLCLGIMLNQSNQNEYQYSLRFNTSDTTDYQELPLNSKEPQINPVKYEDTDNAYKYYEYGVLTIQNWIDNLIAKQFDQQTTISPTLSYVHRPAYTKDPFPENMVGNFGTFLILPIMIIYLRMTHSLIYEKEKKLREGMKMMGLSNTSFYMSWIIQYALIYGIVCVLGTVILKSMVFTESNWGVLIINYWLFCLVLIAQSLFIQVFFTSSLFGLIVAIVFYLLQYMVLNIVGTQNVPTSSYWGASISSMAGASFSYDVICQFEAYGRGVTFSDLDVEINNYYIWIAWSMHILNFLFYLLLAIYLDQVFPNEWGVRKHPLFFLPCFGSGQTRQNQVSMMRSSSKVSQAVDERYEEVELVLKQQEEKNEAVIIKGLNKVYSNGKKAVSNLSLSMYQNQIFALLGHNGAGKTTTISMLTGLLEISTGGAIAYGYDVSTQIDELRKIMGVCPQHDILFDNLTVREHLEMFATFKGMNSNEKDAAIAKIIEDVDLVEKTDYLAKNLSGGQKRKLSVAIAFIGNSKLIYLDEPTSGMDTSARRFIWEMLKNYKEDRIIVLTTHFMDEADFLGDRIGIMGEGKLMCSGSSVFLKNKFGIGYNLTIVKENTQVDSIPIIKSVTSAVPTANVLSNVSAEVSLQLPISSVGLFPKLFDTLDQNLQKLQITTYGISITTLEEVFLKVAKIGVGHQQVEDVKQDLDKSEYDNFDLNSVRVVGACQLFLKHTKALMIKRARVFKRDLKSLFCEIFLPVLIVIFGLGILTIQFIKDDTSVILQPQQLYGSMVLQSDWAGVSTGQQLISEFSTTHWQFDQLDSDLAKADLEYFQKFQKTKTPGWYYIQNTQNNYQYYFFCNTVFLSSEMLLLNSMNQAIIRKISNNKNYSIQVTLDPFPQTYAEETIQQAYVGYSAAFIFSIGMAFIPASIISFIVKEREINIKHQQIVSGVTISAYWISNWILDFVKHFIPTILCALMILAFDVTPMIEQGNYGAMWLFFILYGWAIIPFSYLLSFLFKVPGNSMLITFFFNLLFGSIVSIVIYILVTIESTRDAGKIILWILRPIPSFTFAYGLMDASMKEFFQKLFYNSNDIPSTYDFDVAGADLLLLFLSGIFYFILVFIVEYFEDNGSLQKLGSNENNIPYVPKQLDSDVQQEMEQCDTHNPSEKAVLVQKLRKVFMLDSSNHKVAVDQISFSVDNGEVFGLLGVNGAGKTTTFKILSGELKPTSGTAYVAGYSVIDNIELARQNIGYCPQFDALLENLTVREHLELFADIKGIPERLKQDLVEQKMEEIDLKRFEFVQAGQLSGGNKRKLSVAIAMIGNPPIVFLDEPSTGMDPEARRFMWNVISKIATQRKQSSIILTTHSMEEAEALSTKIAIQVNGNLRCLGSVQHVKNKYGKGYELEVKLQKPSIQSIDQMLGAMQVQRGTKLNKEQTENILTNCIGQQQLINEIQLRGAGSHIYNDLRKPHGLSVEVLAEFILVEQMGQQLKQFIKDSLGQNEVIEHFQTFYRFRLLQQASAGKLFKAFEENKEQLKISQYSIKQASIEQIFNIFAKQDLENKDQKQVYQYEDQVHLSVNEF